MIGIVVVSHSRALAEAAVALATEMVPDDRRPAIAVAGGLDETTFGTDAAAISEALSMADSPEGVLVFVDLGSALLSAEMALEFVDPDLAARVRITPAPLVEGLVAAIVSAATGAGLDVVEQEACHGLLAKQTHLGAPTTAIPTPGTTATAMDAAPPGAPVREFTHVLTNPHGLHARPAARLVAALAGLDADLQVGNASRGRGPVGVGSTVALATLDLRAGDLMRVTASGPDAARALDMLADLAATGFGEDAPAASTALPVGDAAPVRPASEITAPVHRLPGPDDDLPDAPAPGDAEAELSHLDHAVDGVNALLTALPHRTDPGAAVLVEQIVQAQRALLGDPALQQTIRRDIAGGRPAIDAVRDAFGVHERALEAVSDAYLRERAQDLRQLRGMLTRALLGRDVLAVPPRHPHLLVGRELDPPPRPCSIRGPPWRC